jgi:hypothetical protein
MQPDKFRAKRAAAVERREVIRELRAKTGEAETTIVEEVAPKLSPPEEIPRKFNEELETLLRRLKNAPK